MEKDQEKDPNIQKKRKMKIIGIITLLIGISLILAGIYFSIQALN